MPLFTDLPSFGYYYSSNMSPYSNHSSLSGGYTRSPYSSLSSYTGYSRGYSPLLSTISESRAGGVSRINSPKRLHLQSTPKYRVPKPIRINTADIDVSANKYRREKQTAPAPAGTSPESHIVYGVSPTKPAPGPVQDGPFMPRAEPHEDDITNRSTIKRGRTVVRLSTIRSRPAGAVDGDVGKVTWRRELADDLAFKDEKRARKTPGEKLIEKHLIRDKDKPVVITPEPETEEVEDEDVPVCRSRAPSFHDICKDISSDKLYDDLNAGELRKIADRRKSEDKTMISPIMEVPSEIVDVFNEDGTFHRRTTLKKLRKSTKAIFVEVPNTPSVDQNVAFDINFNAQKNEKECKTPKITASVEVQNSGSNLRAVATDVQIETKCTNQKRKFFYKIVVEDVIELNPSECDSRQSKVMKVDKLNNSIGIDDNINKETNNINKEGLYSKESNISSKELDKEIAKHVNKSSISGKRLSKKSLNRGSKSKAAEDNSDNFWDVIGSRESVYLNARRQRILEEQRHRFAGEIIPEVPPAIPEGPEVQAISTTVKPKEKLTNAESVCTNKGQTKPTAGPLSPKSKSSVECNKQTVDKQLIGPKSPLLKTKSANLSTVESKEILQNAESVCTNKAQTKPTSGPLSPKSKSSVECNKEIIDKEKPAGLQSPQLKPKSANTTASKLISEKTSIDKVSSPVEVKTPITKSAPKSTSNENIPEITSVPNKKNDKDSANIIKEAAAPVPKSEVKVEQKLIKPSVNNADKTPKKINLSFDKNANVDDKLLVSGKEMPATKLLSKSTTNEDNRSKNYTNKDVKVEVDSIKASPQDENIVLKTVDKISTKADTKPLSKIQIETNKKDIVPKTSNKEPVKEISKPNTQNNKNSETDTSQLTETNTKPKMKKYTKAKTLDLKTNENKENNNDSAATKDNVTDKKSDIKNLSNITTKQNESAAPQVKKSKSANRTKPDDKCATVSKSTRTNPEETASKPGNTDPKEKVALKADNSKTEMAKNAAVNIEKKKLQPETPSKAAVNKQKLINEVNKPSEVNNNKAVISDVTSAAESKLNNDSLSAKSTEISNKTINVNAQPAEEIKTINQPSPKSYEKSITDLSPSTTTTKPEKPTSSDNSTRQSLKAFTERVTEKVRNPSLRVLVKPSDEPKLKPALVSMNTSSDLTAITKEPITPIMNKRKLFPKDEPATKPLIATPRPLQAIVRNRKAQQMHQSIDSDTDTSDSSWTDSSEEESDESEFFECGSPIDNQTVSLENLISTEPSFAYQKFVETSCIIPPATKIPRFRKYCLDDFNFLKVLGKGSFGKVFLAELKNTEYYYAVKCLNKNIVLEDDDVECTLIERKVLALGTKHPYLCHLFCTFQTESHLFFVMEYLNGGDLMFHIQHSGRFPEPRASFYAAEIVSGLRFLHKKGIVYRDLKLDNILLDFDGHVRIADFGMCKLQIYLDKTADTFCGTPDYMAPEIIKGQRYNQSVDWWSFGVLLYEMLIGQSPFSGCDEDELFWSICNEIPYYPKHLSTEALEILTRFLNKDAEMRLGSGTCPYGDVTDQRFFQNIDWDRLERRLLEPPFKPRVQHPLDTQYFDKAFTGEIARLTPIDDVVMHGMDQERFHGFSYTNPNATD